MKGILIRENIGIGDAIQFTSVPENYYRATKQYLVDVKNNWTLDHNPYVLRGMTSAPEEVFDLWRHWPACNPRSSVLLSLAEKYCYRLKIPVVMKYPRLYFNEDFPVEKREMILLHTNGSMQGPMPDHVIDHVIKKYKNLPLHHLVGPEDFRDLGIPRIKPASKWDMVKVVSECRIFIGMDSGPSWVACCYPDIITKKLRVKPSLDVLQNWVPLDIANAHTHWDDRTHQVFNPSEDDVGFTASYRRL